MATVLFQETNTRYTDQTEVADFLASRGVLYEQWDVSKLPAPLVENFTLTDADKQTILDTFAPKSKTYQNVVGIRQLISSHFRIRHRTLMSCSSTSRKNITTRMMKFVSSSAVMASSRSKTKKSATITSNSILVI